MSVARALVMPWANQEEKSVLRAPALVYSDLMELQSQQIITGEAGDVGNPDLRRFSLVTTPTKGTKMASPRFLDITGAAEGRLCSPCLAKPNNKAGDGSWRAWVVGVIRQLCAGLVGLQGLPWR